MVPKVKELRSLSRKDWLIDSGLMLLYSVFLTANFFIGFVHVYYDDVHTWSWVSGFLVILVSPCFSYLLNDLERTIAIFFCGSLLGFALESITSVILFFHSFWFYRYLERTNEIGEFASPAQLILVYTICVFFISVLGAIVGSYIAERRHKGEKVLSLRCSRCGTWNEQDAANCSFCKKELVEERHAAEARTRTARNTKHKHNSD